MEEVMIRANEQLLKQVWMNLLDNAIKFSLSSGCISVILRTDNGAAIFAVKDQGAGMDDNVKNIFLINSTRVIHHIIWKAMDLAYRW